MNEEKIKDFIEIRRQGKLCWFVQVTLSGCMFVKIDSKIKYITKSLSDVRRFGYFSERFDFLRIFDRNSHCVDRYPKE